MGSWRGYTGAGLSAAGGRFSMVLAAVAYEAGKKGDRPLLRDGRYKIMFWVLVI